jgi:endonuclease G
MRVWHILLLLVVAILGLWAAQLLPESTAPSNPYSATISEETDNPVSSVEPDISSLVYGGIPQPSSPVLLRNGYVLSYDDVRRIPRWVAYRVEPDFLNTPDRKGRFARFRDDPDLDSEPSPEEYTNPGYDRGHLFPYNAAGGDRDGDGLYAERDPDDVETVFQANYMSNITPQTPSFNRHGLWRKLERYIQNQLVMRQQYTVWVIAGTILGSGETHFIGPRRDIAVPTMFYKLVVYRPQGQSASEPPTVLAFLFPHQADPHGEIEDFLVSVDVVENLSDLDFFGAPDDGIDEELEAQDTWRNW